MKHIANAIAIATAVLLASPAAFAGANKDSTANSKQRTAHKKGKVAKKFDLNGNGTLEAAERAALQAAKATAHAAMIAKFDTDGDGELSDTEKQAVREYRAERAAKRKAKRAKKKASNARNRIGKRFEQLLEKFDADHNGTLSLRELTAIDNDQLRERLVAMDANGNDIVTRGEFMQAAKTHAMKRAAKATSKAKAKGKGKAKGKDKGKAKAKATTADEATSSKARGKSVETRDHRADRATSNKGQETKSERVPAKRGKAARL